jgi:TonB family protein
MGSFMLLFLLACTLAAARGPGNNPSQDNATQQAAPLKAIYRPNAEYPEEARRKGVEGKVTMSIVVDVQGNVSQARALSGPEELIPAALATVKTWKFEPPASAPVTETVEFTFGIPKPCAGSVSDQGSAVGSFGLTDRSSRLVAVPEDEGARLPPYPKEERESGVAGKMVLAVSLNPDGSVKDIRVVQSLSAVLDQAAIDTVRPMKFRRAPNNPTARLVDLRLQFTFRALCDPRF